MRIDISLISNVFFEHYWHNNLNKVFSHSFCDIKSRVIPYEEYRYYAEEISDSDIIIVYLSFDVIYPNLVNKVHSKELTYDEAIEDCILKCNELHEFINTHTSAKIMWFGFEDYFDYNCNICGSIFSGNIDKLNLKLSRMYPDDTYIDFKQIIAVLGISSAYDNKGKYRWNSPYSEKLIQSMISEIYKQYMINTGKTKKCLVLDCDNVLWGGILSEDGIEGIQISEFGLGREFWDFQSFVINMYYHGVVLAICSKNNEKDVLQVFRNHSGMLLKEHHISCFQCNWENKPVNIIAISEKLNISLDSIVFVDDLPFELEAVKSLLPEVSTILYHRESVYRELSCFNLKSRIDLEVVKNRTDTYKTNIKREELKKNTPSYEEYISSLNMKIDIHRTEESEIARVSELTQRTNKCTNGYRYTIEQLKLGFIADEDYLLTICLSDRFSHFGVVGVIGVKNKSVVLFSLSCRVLGRNVENLMINHVKELGVNKVFFKSTEKNEYLIKTFESNGLDIIK